MDLHRMKDNESRRPFSKVQNIRSFFDDFLKIVVPCNSFLSVTYTHLIHGQPSNTTMTIANEEAVANEPSLPHQEDAEVGEPDDHPGNPDEADRSRQGTVDTVKLRNASDVELADSMQCLHNTIIEAASLIFPDDIVNQLAHPDIHPSAELCDLYTQALSNSEKGWKPVTIELLSRGILTGRLLFQCLIWAFLRTVVLDKRSPLDDFDRLLDPSGSPGRFIDNILRSRYNLNIAVIRQAVSKAQVNDDNYQRDSMKPKADNLAQDLMLILAGHNDQIDKAVLPQDWPEALLSQLCHICGAALFLRRRLDGGSREWKIVTLEYGEKVLGRPGVQVDPRFQGKNAALTIMPGLLTEVSGGSAKRFVVKALVAAMR